MSCRQPDLFQQLKDAKELVETSQRNFGAGPINIHFLLHTTGLFVDPADPTLVSSSSTSTASRRPELA
jgi:hypothetical protein